MCKKYIQHRQMLPCLSKTGNVCCCQLTSTTTFFSQQTKIKFKIYHKVNCKSECIIYLIDCILCNKQYIEKAETVFSIRLNNHRKDNKGRQTERQRQRDRERDRERKICISKMDNKVMPYQKQYNFLLEIFN